MEVTKRAVAIYAKFLSELNICTSHGMDHALKVLDNCQHAIASYLRESSGQQKVDEQLILSCQLAALLHDADDHKFFPKNIKNENARSILKEAGAIQGTSERAIEMINLVSFSKNGDSQSKHLSPLYYFPRHADRLEATGLMGIIRCYQYNATKKGVLYKETTPLVRNREEISSIIVGRDAKYILNGGNSDSFIDHFYDKLLHIKCPQSVAGNSFFREEYTRRRGLLEDFVLEASRTNFLEIDRQVQDLARAGNRQF